MKEVLESEVMNKEVKEITLSDEDMDLLRKVSDQTGCHRIYSEKLEKEVIRQ